MSATSQSPPNPSPSPENSFTPNSKKNVVIATLKLTRWQEFLLFTSVLSLLGGLTAHQVREVDLDWRLGAVWLANLLAMAYAFMINDIEDAEDDAHEAERGSRNPITTGELPRGLGLVTARGTALLALVFYGLGGNVPFITGAIILILAHLYSWKPVRLKALPLVDILSHAMFLSMLLFLATFFIYSTHLGHLWILALGTWLISAYGQFYNQVRDYESDRAAGLRNSASILGKTITRILAYSSSGGFVLAVCISIGLGVFPLFLAPVLLIAGPVILYLGRHNTRDMRGTETSDPMAKSQEQFLIIFNIVLLVWLIQVIATQN